MSNGINKMLKRRSEKIAKVRAEYDSYLNVFSKERMHKAFTLNKITLVIISKDWSLSYMEIPTSNHAAIT